ncbi:MAG: KpsF/GutQ family sugar-phosphate isomerase [Planctomycetota bacterium]|nr:KpsF/GutQ family sugar-phosphate isomerase [Planctomycetota bacterium]
MVKRTKRPRIAADLAYARGVLEVEAATLKRLVPRIGKEYAQAAGMFYRCKGNVITSGIGKAGIIAQKISATLASTGTPSHFLHAAEAVHGDLGRVRPHDIVLILSYGGETAEVTRLLGQLVKMGVPIVAMTGTNDSTLARKAKVILWMGRIDEACPMGLAPTATTTAMLALGDALALTVLKMRQRDGRFSREEFALFHPGGSLGRQLLMVETLMRSGRDLPVARDSLTLGDALGSLRNIHRRSGAMCLVNARGKLTGIFTDADLRRLLETGGSDALAHPVSDVMTRNPKFVRVTDSAADAIEIINRYFIEELPVVDAKGRLVGLVDVQDLLATGVGL